MTDPKQAAAIELTNIATESQACFRQLADRLLDADLLLTAWGPAVIDTATAARAKGRRIVIEIAADDDGQAVISLLAAAGDSREFIASMRKPVAN